MGDGIHAAASLALDEGCTEPHETVDLLWQMAARAGFKRPKEAR